jgi:hypothetical protein
MFFPAFSSQIQRRPLLPSSAGQDGSLVQAVGIERVEPDEPAAPIGPPEAKSMPKSHAFSNWRFFDIFAPPSTQVGHQAVRG